MKRNLFLASFALAGLIAGNAAPVSAGQDDPPKTRAEQLKEQKARLLQERLAEADDQRRLDEKLKELNRRSAERMRFDQKQPTAEQKGTYQSNPPDPADPGKSGVRKVTFKDPPAGTNGPSPEVPSRYRDASSSRQPVPQSTAGSASTRRPGQNQLGTATKPSATAAPSASAKPKPKPTPKQRIRLRGR